MRREGGEVSTGQRAENQSPIRIYVGRGKSPVTLSVDRYTGYVLSRTKRGKQRADDLLLKKAAAEILCPVCFHGFKNQSSCDQHTEIHKTGEITLEDLEMDRRETEWQRIQSMKR